MGKRGLIVFSTLTIFLLNTIIGATITGEVITGQAVNQVGMNITITNGPPALTIISPTNSTYTTNTSFLLNYSTTGINVWYNINNSANTTITGPLFLNISEGSHTLFLFANNSYGETSEQINFTIDLSEEVQESPSTGGGGGSGITAEAIKKFEINTDQINVKLKQGEIKTQTIKIKNKENQKLNFKITKSQEITEQILIEDHSFELGPGQEKTIEIIFLAKESIIPDLYLGKILIQSGNSIKEILIGLEIISKQELFDVEIDLSEKYKIITCGEELIFKTRIYNLGETKRVDAYIEYFIKDKDGKIILYEEETNAIETHLDTVKEFNFPKDILPGDYVIYVKVKYGEEIASATQWFSIEEECFYKKYSKEITYGSIGFSIILLIITIILLFIVLKNKKRSTRKRKTLHQKIFSR